MNTKTVNKIGLDADEILKKDIDLNNSGADKAAQDAADSYSSALMMLAVILGAAVIVGVGVSFYLVRDVSQRHRLDRAADAGAGPGRSDRATCRTRARRPKSAPWRMRCRCSRKR